MTDWAKSGRVDAYSARLVDPMTLTELPGDIPIDASKCTVTWAKDAERVVSARACLIDRNTYADIGGGRVDCMVRLYHGIKVDGHDTLGHPEPVGTFFTETAGTESRFGKAFRSVNCYSAMIRHSEDCLVRDYSFLGADSADETKNGCVRFIRHVIEADGGSLVVDASCHEQDPATGKTPVSWTFGRDVFFPIGSNKAEVIRKVAGWIACELDVTPDGRILIRRSVPVLQRPMAYTFEEGRNCVYLPGIKWTDERAGTYNRVLATRNGGDGTEVAVANLSDTSTGSFAMLGRHKTKTVTVSDDSDLADVAEQELRAIGPGVFIEVESVSVPGLAPGSLVRYVNGTDWLKGERIDALCEVVEMQQSFDLGCTTKWKMQVIQ